MPPERCERLRTAHRFALDEVQHRQAAEVEVVEVEGQCTAVKRSAAQRVETVAAVREAARLRREAQSKLVSR